MPNWPSGLYLVLWAGTGLARPPDVVIRRSAREVLLDVVIRDAHGKLVTNLQQGDVAVYEDGVRQDVRCYRRPSVIHFTWKQGWPAVRRLLLVIERKLAPFEPRPHWASRSPYRRLNSDHGTRS